MTYTVLDLGARLYWPIFGRGDAIQLQGDLQEPLVLLG